MTIKRGSGAIEDNSKTTTIKSWAENLQVEYKIVNNFVKSSNISYPWPNSDAFDFTVTLRNNGDETISGNILWAIYFYQDQGVYCMNSDIKRVFDIMRTR